MSCIKLPQGKPWYRSAAAAALLSAGSARSLDVTGLTLRGFTYQAVGQLAQRQPQAFAGRTDIAARWGELEPLQARVGALSLCASAAVLVSCFLWLL